MPGPSYHIPVVVVCLAARKVEHCNGYRQVRECKHSVTVLTISSEFDRCQWLQLRGLSGSCDPCVGWVAGAYLRDDVMAKHQPMRLRGWLGIPHAAIFRVKMVPKVAGELNRFPAPKCACRSSFKLSVVVFRS